jgi:WD40 repeat protein
MWMTGTTRAVLGTVSLLVLLAADSPGTAGELKKAEPARDFLGDSLPAGAVARLGTTRLRHKSTTSLRFSADNKELATTGIAWDSHGKTVSAIRWWDAATGRLLRELQFPGQVFNWAALPDGKRLALGVEDDKGSRIVLWDLARGKEIGGPLMEHAGEILFLAVLGDGNTLVCHDESDKGFCFWDLKKRKKIKTLLPIRSRNKDYMTYTQALSRDGRRSAWHFATFETEKDKSPGKIDGEFIQVIEDGKKKVYENKIDEKKDHLTSGTQLALSPDGRWLAWATNEQFPQIVDLDTKKTITPFPSPKGLGYCTWTFARFPEQVASPAFFLAG